MERLKIAITGATGFVGANLVTYLRKRNYEVYPMVRKDSNTWRLSHSRNDIDVSYIDIEDRNNIFKSVRKIKPDVLIHTASYGVYPYENYRNKIYRTNLNGTMNVVDAGIAAGVPFIINTGTCSEYGKKDRPMKESDEIHPETDYATSKSLATQYCAFKSNKETKIITLRLFTPYGYYEHRSRLIPYLLYSSINGTKVSLSSPSNVRDFVFIEDVINAYKLAIINKNKIDTSTILNIGYGKQHKLVDLVRIVSRLSGRNLDVEWTGEKRRPGDGIKMWQANINKARNIIGWKPMVSLDKGLMKTSIWIKENIELYRNSKSR